MKKFILLLLLGLSGCSAHYTTESFIYQDKQPEQPLNINIIQTQLHQDNLSTLVSSINFTSNDGTQLSGIKLMNKEAVINLIFFSANGMKISQSSKILNKFSLLPVNIIWFDYRGMGVSDKKSTLSLTSLKTDALGVFDYSKKTLPQHLPMAIHGLSMGSIIASYVAVNKEVDALILDGAISSVSTLVDNLMPTWSKPFYSVTLSAELAEIDNSDFIKDYTKPLLLLIGADDSITPPANSEQLYQLSPSEIKVLALISDTEHAKTMKKSQTIKAYLHFINTITCCKSS